MVYLEIFIFVIFQFFSLKNYSKCYKYKDNNEKKINNNNLNNNNNDKNNNNLDNNDNNGDENKKEKYEDYFELKNNEYKHDEYINDGINIVLCTDENYFIPALITIKSIINSKEKNTKYNFYIFLNKKAFDKYNSIFESFKNKYIDKKECSIYRRIMDKNTYDNCVSGHWRLTNACFYRLDIPYYFNDIEIVIYLDSDMLVRHDLGNIYNTNFDDCYCLAVVDGACNKQINNLKEYNLDKYFNSGFLVLNCKKIRKENKYKKLAELLRINDEKKFSFYDQDILNICFENKVKIISPKYNYVLNLYYGGMIGDYNNTKNVKIYLNNLLFLNEKDYEKEWNKIQQDPTIVHFTRPKPWFLEKEIDFTSGNFDEYYKSEFGTGETFINNTEEIRKKYYENNFKPYLLEWKNIEKQLVDDLVIEKGWDKK